MKRPYEFKFSGIPREPRNVTIDLDEVLSYNEMTPIDGHGYRTRVKLKMYAEEHISDAHGYILDIK